MTQPQDSVEISEILADFMEAIEEVGSEIAGSPSVQDLEAVNDVYEEAIQKLNSLFLKRIEDLVGEDEELPELNPFEVRTPEDLIEIGKRNQIIGRNKLRATIKKAIQNE